jgi:hypothetical protein
MPEVTVRRNSPRYLMVLAADVVELPRGAKMSGRTSDISRSGCYVDTLNPIPRGSCVKVRFTHHQEEFEAIGLVVYVSQRLGMGIQFTQVSDDQQARPNQWLEELPREF